MISYRQSDILDAIKNRDDKTYDRFAMIIFHAIKRFCEKRRIEDMTPESMWKKFEVNGSLFDYMEKQLSKEDMHTLAHDLMSDVWKSQKLYDAFIKYARTQLK